MSINSAEMERKFQGCPEPTETIHVAVSALCDPLHDSQFTFETLARADLSDRFKSVFEKCLLLQLENKSQREFHSIVFQITSNALSYGGWFRELARGLVDRTIDRDILGLSNCLAFSEVPLEEYASHADPLVRWCLLGHIVRDPRQTAAWKRDGDVLERLKHDPFPPVATQANYLIEERQLGKQRKSPPLSFDRFAAEFYSFHPGDYGREDIERFLKLKLKL